MTSEGRDRFTMTTDKSGDQTTVRVTSQATTKEIKFDSCPAYASQAFAYPFACSVSIELAL